MYRTIRSWTENPYQLPKSVPAWIFSTVMPVILNVIEASHQIDYRGPNIPEIFVIKSFIEKRFVNKENKYLEYPEQAKMNKRAKIMFRKLCYLSDLLG